MNITEYHSPEKFLSVLKNSMSASSDENDFMLGLVNILLQDPSHFGTPPFLATVEEQNQMKLSAFLTPPWPLLLYTKKNTCLIPLHTSGASKTTVKRTLK